ncbi:b(o/a)3-type cytochrome-c oxidase subunit 1 [Kurthia sibirica]|uniref:Cytochrome C n=1 Tax=Kurthia sibirica TaxID=202750 RepID=A0A2U3APM5_9BACL|nr:b(o/a)3-type cytochrome-c oxidase subunit 1 [Kurthia sibirica]PWI26492.1 cytochrome C [Kurthia sibirica]GEK33062.1 cytochrome c oxidase subunit I [Kurthia sibirica]
MTGKSFESASANNVHPKQVDPRDARLSMAHIYVAFIALFIGGLAGLLQVLVRADTIKLPEPINYYQVLTVHGVLLGLILTIFFIFGFQTAAMSRAVGTLTDQQRLLGWIGFWVMTVGTVMAAVMVLLNEATVLYTFYAPLQAHWIFYAGLALVVIGTWLAALSESLRWIQWRKENPNQTSPLIGFMIICNNLMWFVATIGVATEVLFQLLPWSLGIVDRVDVLLSRTLFWSFGHALVYFWLLPAYMVWYVVVPKVIGGKIFSDSLARLSFIMFVLFSVPVGLHHQLTEPGVDASWKFFQVVLTMMVVIPSLLTAFSLFATFELRGRELGAKGVFSWLKKLPWGDVRFFAPFIGMLVFIPGGAGGIVNASNQMNQLIHNTIWVTGHFHLTVATAVVLTFFGATYWLVPHLTGRQLTKEMNKLGIIQTILWALGMGIMSISMHAAGLLGAPRRSSFSDYGGADLAKTWLSYQVGQAVGGTLLFIAILLFLYIFIKLRWSSTHKGFEEFPIGTVSEHAQKTPPILENFKLWIVILVALVLIAYTYPIYDIISNSPLGSKGYKLW